MKIIVNILSFFIALPFLAFFVAYFISKRIKKDKKQAMNIAINITTFCLFLSVSVMFQVIGNYKSGTFVTILLLLLIFAGLMLLQWKVKNDIDLPKGIYNAFRLWFVVLCVCYVVLFFSSIINAIK